MHTTPHHAFRAILPGRCSFSPVREPGADSRCDPVPQHVPELVKHLAVKIQTGGSSNVFRGCLHDHHRHPSLIWLLFPAPLCDPLHHGARPRDAEHEMRRLVARNVSTNTVIADRVGVAATRAARAVGLLSRSGFEPGEALWIVPSRGVHTWGMRVPSDVLALDVTNSLIRSDTGMTVAAIGLDGMICVVTQDAVFIATKYSQGGRRHYSLQLPLEQIINFLPKPDPDKPAS